MAARRTPTKTARETKATSRVGDTPEAEAPVEGKGMSFADTLILVTTLVMIAAFVLIDKFRGEAFNEGLFFTR